jgi:acetolactate synthase-1/2/3 large subunit
MPSQAYTLLDIPAPRQTFVHIFPGVEELGKVYRPTLAINATPTAFAAALEGLQPPNELRWRGETPIAHADFLAWTDKPTVVPGPVNLGEIIVALRDKLPADAVVCNGAGNFSVWVHRYTRYRRYGTQLAPISGSMGYGVPAAIGMKRLAPERTVVAFAGDGDFLMTGQEFATAVQYELPVIVVVVDNGMYGTIRMHQERHYPGRVIGTGLKNPDFAAYARAFGGYGATVEKTADFMAAFEAAQQSGKPAIIHLKVDPEALLPTISLTATREKAQAGG